MSVPIVLVASKLRGGGTERVVVTLANAWARQGRKVTVCVLGHSKEHDDDYQCEPSVRRVYMRPLRKTLLKRIKVMIRQLPGFQKVEMRLRRSAANVMTLAWRHHRTRGLLYRLYQLRVSRRTRHLRRMLRAANAPVVLSMGYRTNLTTINAASSLDMRVIISERNDPDIMRSTFDMRYAAYPMADLVTGNSRDIVRKLARYVPPQQINYVPNPLRCDGVSDDEEIVVRWAAPTILITARLVPQKNHQLLFSAFATQAERLPGWRVAVLGDGHFRPELEAIVEALGIAQRVDWYGHVPSPRAFYQAADIFVLPSLYEGQPNALLEAMQAGLPVIVSDIAPHTELIEYGRNGLLVPVDDVAAMAQALTTLADNVRLRKELGKAARQTSAAFQIDNVLPCWDALIDRVLRESQDAVIPQAVGVS
jgi:GalNAc-alpha-(1->4)-GalNAc-alpha-(1->3)-diNAcBac-PP-undecaprenol alpha-1,4-N-acetyl-D-galactosaminyltransferase